MLVRDAENRLHAALVHTAILVVIVIAAPSELAHAQEVLGPDEPGEGTAAARGDGETPDRASPGGDAEQVDGDRPEPDAGAGDGVDDADGQDGDPDDPVGRAVRGGDRERIVDRSLRSLAAERIARETELQAAQRALDEATSPAEREEYATRVRDLKAEIVTLTRRFESLVGEIDVSQFFDEPSGEFDVRKEIESLLEVLIREIKSGTEGPRTIARMRSRIDVLRQLEGLAGTAVQNATNARVEAVAGGATEQVVAEIDRALRSWKDRLSSMRRQRDVLVAELQTKLDAQQSVFESAGSVLNTFFRTRGLNLLIGGGAFLAVFLSLRFVQRRLLQRYRPDRTRSFYARAFNVLFYVFTFLAAIVALFLALFAVNDWTLLLLVLLFLLGVGWASIRMLPQFLEQIRLLLNLGSVREGERLIFAGLPWRVDALMLYTRLRNPLLTGGEMRVPIRDIVSLHSRPLGRNERWFPTREEDWAILGDGRFGKVELQTPDMVHVRLLGGSIVTYPAADFLELHPENLSEGFCVQITFGIDYVHQPIATTEVPRRMQDKVSEGILDLVSPAELVRIAVEFSEASASSLDYAVLADFRGSAAPRYKRIRRALFALLVDCANEQGWTIPFTQVTVHQAERSGA